MGLTKRLRRVVVDLHVNSLEDSDDEGEEIQILETTTSSSTPSFSYPTIFPSTSAREEGVDNIFETAAVQAAATVSNSMVVNVQMLAGEKEAFPVKMKKEETIKEFIDRLERERELKKKGITVSSSKSKQKKVTDVSKPLQKAYPGVTMEDLFGEDYEEIPSPPSRN